MQKKYYYGIVVVAATLGFVFAQDVTTAVTTSGDVDPSGTPSTCVDLQNNLRFKMKDSGTDGDVNSLQDFLIAANLMQGDSTGFFGAGTFKAVKLFQSRVSLSPTGYVGAYTRAKIKELSCSGGTIPNLMEKPRSTSSGLQGTSGQGGVVGKGEGQNARPVIACTMEMRMCPDGTGMDRDMNTCRWMAEKCAGYASGTPQLPTGKPGTVPGSNGSAGTPSKAELEARAKTIIEIQRILASTTLTTEQRAYAEAKLKMLQSPTTAPATGKPAGSVPPVPRTNMGGTVLMVGSTTITGMPLPPAEPLQYPYPPKGAPMEIR